MLVQPCSYKILFQANDVLNVLKIYHTFINGTSDDYVKQMQMEYPDVRINIPPLMKMMYWLLWIKEMNRALVITVLCIDNDVDLNSMMIIN